MKIGNIQKCSLIDYPGKLCGIVFTQGCNFRCPYCHNPELSNPDLYEKGIPEEEFFSFLEKRTGKLDAVSITGGEPTIQNDLPEFMKIIKNMNYSVKIDTNGSHPDVLEYLINEGLVDFIAMDVKAPLEKYKKMTRSEIQPDIITQSIDIIMSSGIDYEFRTTVVKSLLNKTDILEIGKLIKNAKHYAIQKFVPSKTLDKSLLNETTYSDDDFETIKGNLQHSIQSVTIR